MSPTQRIDVPSNSRPIIGVLSHELSTGMKYNLNVSHSSYIAASYVKFLEGAGARVVPIWIGKGKSYYKKVIYSLNGVLFPGGAAEFTDPDGYAEAGVYLYEYAIKMNEKGVYFPLWGTCLGMELMTFLAAGRREHRCDCWGYDQALPLTLKSDFQRSKLFENVPESMLDIFMNKPVAAHYHQFCITERNMTYFGLDAEWKILATAIDTQGLEFVSIIESRLYPFYAVMFHPEKNAYEWKPTKNIPHSSEAVAAMHYFGDFLVSEARKNSNSFPGKDAENDALIYNYAPTYTGRKRSVFEQCYFFD
ncbi:gamma-glutamyl hydrolase-like [Anabrus simplex]|uniref:gamma-glutamyl hydrolase-like n=1 Tax=Anabrus simplex TaxID=316456 RepID=UPI0034DD4F68